MKLGYKCKFCCGDMYEICDYIQCDTCGYIIHLNGKEDYSSMLLTAEYQEFIKTDIGKEWRSEWQRQTGSDIAGDFGDYLYDFYTEMLM